MYTLTFVSIVVASVICTLGAWADDSSITITVKNSCKNDLLVHQLENDKPTSDQVRWMKAGDERDYVVSSKWGGRFWARSECDSHATEDCNPGAPASLAEFLMQGSAQYDFYDVSFVDGYNLPIRIEPAQEKEGKGFSCGAPACARLPDCDPALQVKDSKGNVVGCNSACHAFGTDEHCCLNGFNTPDKCKASHHAEPVKKTCPDVYSFAYDDQSSTFTCKSKAYTVTFCPHD